MMHRTSRPELRALELAQAASYTNIPHDHGSKSPVVSLAAVPTVNPEPAYIAASAASQIVTSEYQSQHPDWEEENVNPLMHEIALVSPASLSLINAFLDRLLFNFLASARSTSLASLRPAVIEVLKPRLAKEAIAGADEELQEFLGGGDEEELEDFHNGHESQDEWDLELAWKRARLRCMVYTRLGDMEEEDEDTYIDQEQLEDLTSPRRLSRDVGIVSPAVAIFLTSILEFVGEHALMIAGDAAYRRCEIRCRSDRRRSEASQRVIVEETDMEKVALNPTLGRLWRSWRKLLRSPRSSISRIMSREMVSHKGLPGFSTSRSTSRQSSIGAADAVYMHSSLDRRPSVAEILNRPDPASIPLPLTDYDVAEIEVPGYSPDAVPASSDLSRLQQRSLSLVRVGEMSQRPPRSPDVGSPTFAEQERARRNPSPSVPASSNRQVRSRSLPTPAKASFGELDHLVSGAIHTAEASQSSKDARPPMSVLNAISKHAARELQLPETTSSRSGFSEDQVKGIEQSKHSEGKGTPISGSTKSLIASLAKPREDAETRYSTSSSVATSNDGGVSPVDPAYVESGEVSPIDASDDEDVIFQATVAPAATLRRATDRGRIVSTEYDRGQVLRQEMSEEDERIDQSRSTPLGPGRQRGMDGPTEDDYAKDEKREAFVVLEDPLMTHSARSSDASVLSGKDLQADGTISNIRARMQGTENGVPPLTPLREMMEAASGSDDDASSFEPAHVENTRHSPSTVRTASQSSSIPPSNNTKFSDLRRQLPAVYTGPPPAGVERAGVQRVSPSPGGYREPHTPQERVPGSIVRDQQFTYVQPSSASPVSLKTKARAGSQSGGNGLATATSRTSTDGNKVAPEGRFRRGSSLSGDKEKDFEQLINSDATIQYTLTPQNMREIEGPESPQYQSTRPQVASRGSGTSAEQSRPVTGRSHTPSVSKEVKRALESNIGNFPTPAGPTFIIHAGPPVKRGPQAQARDARVESANIRDFADFIRSTGPEQPKSLPRLPTASSTKSGSTVMSNTRSQKSSGTTSPRTLVKSPPGVNPIIAPLISENKALKKGGTRLQAREATISRNDESSDLIDFLRQGPPTERNDGNRIPPRTVPPFRATNDSDEMQAVSPGKPKDTHSLASTQDSLVAKSLHSSVNSRTGLLDSSNRQGSKLSSPPTAMNAHRFKEPPQPPIRKQRRIRDPYEVDSDDEMDEDASHTPRPQLQESKEESLLDFLNSTPPPEANYDPPPLDIPQSAVKGIQRKNSSSIRSRFIRTSNNAAKASATKGNSSSKSAATSSYNGGSISTSRIPEESIPQSQTTTNTYKQGLTAYNNGGGRSNSGMVKPIGKSVQARSATTTDSVRDLADFLMNSGPPEPPTSRGGAGSSYNSSGTVLKEESGGFSKMFSRRKKLAGFA